MNLNTLHGRDPGRFSRRSFIVGTGSIIGAAALGGMAVADIGDGAHVPVLVIGTGYGGSVTALRLAQAGVDVHMVELGMAWDTPGTDGKIFANTTSPDYRSFWLRTKTKQPISNFLGFPIDRNVPRFTGILDAEEFAGITVYQGRGVGGGSLVNGGMAPTPERAYFEMVLPHVDANQMYRRFYPLAKRMLGVNSIDPRYLERTPAYRYARVSRKLAHQAGFRTTVIPSVYDFRYLQREERRQVPRSALAGEVLYGNNHGKKSLDQTYLADAVGTGNVTIRTLTKVTSIRRERDDYVLTLERIDAWGKVVWRGELGCRHLFLGAGSLGTTELLLRARETGALPNLPESIGRGWGPNGNVMTARANHLWDRTGTLQSTIPTLAINNLHDPVHPALAEIAPLPVGIETWASLYLTITSNAERGRFVFDRASNKAKLLWGPNQSDPAIQATKALFDKINRASGTTYRHDLFGNNERFAANFCYHPLGGCVLGQATNNYGQVKGYPNLYVTDGALIPGSISVNPFLTITALAERNITHHLPTLTP